MNGFRVYPIDTATGPVPASSRRDLYAIYLLTGRRQVPYADQAVLRGRTCLCFGTPPVVGSGEVAAERLTGYCCLITEAFVNESDLAGGPEGWLRAILNRNGTSAYFLPDEQAAYLTSLFERILVQHQTTYHFKHELVRSYLQLILHEAVRLRQRPAKRYFRYYFRQQGSTSIPHLKWCSRQRGAI